MSKLLKMNEAITPPVRDFSPPLPPRSREKPKPQRFFVDSLTLTGEVYLVPAARRIEWDAFDAACEETCEELPVPAWAKSIEQLAWLEFEAPVEVFK